MPHSVAPSPSSSSVECCALSEPLLSSASRSDEREKKDPGYHCAPETCDNNNRETDSYSSFRGGIAETAVGVVTRGIPVTNPVGRGNTNSNDNDNDNGSSTEAATSSSSSTTTTRRRRRSRNVPLTLLYTFLAFGGRSLWSSSVLSAFVYLLRNDNPEAVGTLTAVMGLSQLLSSFPAGALADTYRRDVLLHAASIVGIIASVATAWASHEQSYRALTASLGIWGVYWGMSNTSLGALFADSIGDGDRSKYFTQRAILVQLGSTAGPIVALIMFVALGDQWTLYDCTFVMMVGQVICLPGVMLLCFLSDDYALVCPHHEEEEDEKNDDEEGSATEPLLTQSKQQREQSLSRTTSNDKEEGRGNDNDSEPSSNRRHTQCHGHRRRRRRCFCISHKRYIPVLCATADVMMGFAAGMSIRYFPIFFLDNLKLSPVMVQILYMITPLLQAILSKVAQIGGSKVGRCQMTVIHKFIGVSLMIGMVESYNHKLPVTMTCVLYLMRTAFMNSTSALTRSVLMDSVPQRERGKWSALESVTMFSWSGSAAIGGILVGLRGIIFNFYVTAALQFVATWPLIALFTENMDEKAMREASIADASDLEASRNGLALNEEKRRSTMALSEDEAPTDDTCTDDDDVERA